MTFLNVILCLKHTFQDIVIIDDKKLLFKVKTFGVYLMPLKKNIDSLGWQSQKNCQLHFRTDTSDRCQIFMKKKFLCRRKQNWHVIKNNALNVNK